MSICIIAVTYNTSKEGYLECLKCAALEGHRGEESGWHSGQESCGTHTTAAVQEEVNEALGLHALYIHQGCCSLVYILELFSFPAQEMQTAFYNLSNLCLDCPIFACISLNKNNLP